MLGNQRHERFAQEIAKGASNPDAYGRAGFSVTNARATNASASRLLAQPSIKARVAELLLLRNDMAIKSTEKAVEALSIDREWVMGLLKENAERALQRFPVVDANGVVVAYKYDGAVANRALELLGKEMGMFIDRKDVTTRDGDLERMTDAELRAAVESRARRIDVLLARSRGNGAARESSHSSPSTRPH